MKTTTSPHPAVSTGEIARRARELWFARGSPDGQDVEIWLEAERQLTAVSPLRKEPAKPRKIGTTISETAMREPEAVDAGELQEPLSRFGEPGPRSPTSLDLT